MLLHLKRPARRYFARREISEAAKKQLTLFCDTALLTAYVLPTMLLQTPVPHEQSWLFVNFILLAAGNTFHVVILPSLTNGEQSVKVTSNG